MIRKAAVVIFLAVISALVLVSNASIAAEITLRMKGGGFEIRGELKAFDGANYIIKSPELGLLEINSSRYECVGNGCPTAGGGIPRSSTALSGPSGVGRLGEATFIGGSAIGTQFMPELIASYAANNGLSLEKSVGQDNRDLVFTLTGSAGNETGRVTIMRRGGPAGFEALHSGKADLVWSSRPINDGEAGRFTAQGFNMRASGNEHVFALDALVVLVNRENTSISLSLDRIAQIFAGQITDWGELGQPPGKINVYAPIYSMGTWTAFEDTLLKPRGLSITSDAKRLPTAIEWSDAVAADPSGIGITMMAYVRGAKALNIEQSCGLTSKPSIFSAKTEEFPLARRLYFYTKGQPRSRVARELLAFALSANSQEALKNAQFVDQAPELLPFRDQAGRIAYALNAQDEDFRLDSMRSLISELSQASRLSTTFRFALGSAFLDSKAQEDVVRLARELRKPPYRDRKVMLIGFADSAGNYNVNQKVSKARANTVVKALNRAGYKEAVAKAYGELAPVACNDTPAGRYLNRRVEVWVQ